MAAKSTKSEGQFIKSIKYNQNAINKEAELVRESNCVNINRNSVKNNNNNTTHNSNNNNILVPANSKADVLKSCDCTNISIMHLFHEMKQNFPTIPDTIVAEYVSENCHQRENCIKMLRKELELKPVPTQTYPTKIVHSSNINFINYPPNITKTAVQQENQLEVKSLSQMFKPIRPAPAPPQSMFKQNIQLKKRNQGAKSPLSEIMSSQNDEIKLPIVKNKAQLSQIHLINNNVTRTGGNISNMSKMRPTSLHLEKIPQQQKHKFSNIQLQQHVQSDQQKSLKPSRKAPLPPVQPSKLKNTCTLSNNTSTNLISSLPESEISVNFSVSTPTTTDSMSQQCTSPGKLLSPKRHRSVITLQPEPPYTRDFLISSARPAFASHMNDDKRMEEEKTETPIGMGTKSFTSVNLTLRQPTITVGRSSQHRPSTIDISAGPGLAGVAGTGFTYFSSSYDARQGYQKNFHLTVTDEGGVISASRINQKHKDILRQQHCLLKQQKQQQDMSKKDLTISNLQTTLPESINENIDVVIKRQKGRCDKLQLALDENKKRLHRVNKEIKIIKDPIRHDVKDQLVLDIQKLCRNCESIVDEIENMRKSATTSQHSGMLNAMHQMQSVPQQEQNSSVQDGEQITLPQQQQRNLDNEMIYKSDEFDDNNDIAGNDNDNDDAAHEFWECQLCTFHNYPDLNICESCNVVRILPGTLSNFNLSRVANVDSTTANFHNNNNLDQLSNHIEHDTNCLSQHFAVHI